MLFGFFQIVSVGGLLNTEFYLDKPAPAKLFQSHFTSEQTGCVCVVALDRLKMSLP